MRKSKSDIILKEEMTREIEGWEERLPEGGEPFFMLYAQYVNLKNRERYTRKNYNRYTFEYIYEGEGILEIDNLAYQLKAGDIYILPKGHSHNYYPTGSVWRKVFMNCVGQLPGNLLDAYGLSARYHFSNCTNPRFREIFETFESSFFSEKPDLQREGALLLHELIELLYEHEKDRSTSNLFLLSHKVRHVLDRSVFMKLNIDDLAKRFNISNWYLTKTFKAEMGITPYEYHLCKRVDLAREMLVNGDLSITEIADKLNFSDQFHFSKIFKKKTGVSPKKYRTEKS